jgi:hypothetical protein
MGIYAHQETVEKEVHKPVRHTADPLASAVALLIWAALGFLGLLVVMLTLAFGF